MLRLRLELIPDGIQEMATTSETIVIACRYPLDHPESQMIDIYRNGETRAEMVYDLLNTCYRPPPGKQPDWLGVARAALNKIIDYPTERAQGMEVDNGLLALEPGEFDTLLAEMVQKYPEIQRVILFGRRARELPTLERFTREFGDVTRQNGGYIVGEYILRNHPAYIKYDLCLWLDPACYQRTQTYKAAGYDSEGEYFEHVLHRHYGFRKHPHVPRMLAGNGLTMYFVRPDGNIANFVLMNLKPQVLTPTSSIQDKDRIKVTDLEAFRAEIEAGRLLYDQAHGLQPYPGIKIEAGRLLFDQAHGLQPYPGIKQGEKRTRHKH